MTRTNSSEQAPAGSISTQPRTPATLLRWPANGRLLKSPHGLVSRTSSWDTFETHDSERQVFFNFPEIKHEPSLPVCKIFYIPSDWQESDRDRNSPPPIPKCRNPMTPTVVGKLPSYRVGARQSTACCNQCTAAESCSPLSGVCQDLTKIQRSMNDFKARFQLGGQE
ncbi:hypothetical protein B0H10DRAFT_1958370 [Mycena sp. CBHHK59/15]|nr:hypothetical protein B0H10DRAFT_1958370 [Mycena sp. CBHHK59/15]